MKALSIKQPFASMIANGIKTIETRTWEPLYRGPVLLCASKALHTGTVIYKGEEYDAREFIRMCERAGHQCPTGVMLCIAELVDCRAMIKDDEEAACCQLYPFARAWEFRDIRPVEQRQVKGMLGLFEIPDSEIKTLAGIGRKSHFCNAETK